MELRPSEAPGAKVRLVLADDHDRVREGLRRVIDAQNDMEVVGEADDGRGALRLVAELHPEILLVDVSMPGMGGVEVTRAVRDASTCPHVVAVTRHREPRCLDAMLEAGAAGYVLKQSPSSELLRAIRSVAAGISYIDAALPQGGSAIPLPRAMSPAPYRDAVHALDKTEWAVLDLLASAHSDVEIAVRLSVSTAAVASVTSSAMQKAGLRSRGEVAAFIQSRGRHS